MVVAGVGAGGCCGGGNDAQLCQAVVAVVVKRVQRSLVPPPEGGLLAAVATRPLVTRNAAVTETWKRRCSHRDQPGKGSCKGQLGLTRRQRVRQRLDRIRK